MSLGIVPHRCPSVSLSGAAVSQKRAVVIEQRKRVVDGVVGAESREPTKRVKIYLIQNSISDSQNVGAGS